MAVAVPIGLGAAIYLSEYARPGVRKILKPIARGAGRASPSVVLGFFAVSADRPVGRAAASPARGLFSLMSAGIAVGILSIPLVASVSEDALRSVPQALREASYGMGAKKITTTVRVVLPAAVSGLVAAFILAVSRAIGETMVVFIAAGAGGNRCSRPTRWSPGSRSPRRWRRRPGHRPGGPGEALTFQSLYFVGAVLFVITLVLNLVADRFVRRVRQAY